LGKLAAWFRLHWLFNTYITACVHCSFTSAHSTKMSPRPGWWDDG